MRVRLVAGHAPFFFNSANIYQKRFADKGRTVAPLLKGIAPLKKIHQLSECAALTLWFFIPLCSALLQRSSARARVCVRKSGRQKHVSHAPGPRVMLRCLLSYISGAAAFLRR
jgi:hypothetical protein